LLLAINLIKINTQEN